MNDIEKTKNQKWIALQVFVLTVILIGVFLNLNATKTQRRLADSLNYLHTTYLSFKTGLENEAAAISQNTKTIEAFTNKSPLDLNASKAFSDYEMFDIHGNGLNGTEQSIRGSLAYQRLMGHLDYYSVLESRNGKAYTTTIAKVFAPEREFIGIIKLYALMETLLDNLQDSLHGLNGLYMVDANKTLISLNGEAYSANAANDKDLIEVARQTSLMQDLEGFVEITEPEHKGQYFYTTGSGLTVLGKAE